MLTSLVRVSRFAIQNFWRDIWLSSVTIVIFVLAITLVGVLSGVKVITDQAIVILRSKVDVTVTFKPGTPEPTALDLKTKLETLPETTAVSYTSAEENLKIFKQLHANDPTVLDSTAALDRNPFGPSVKVVARSLEEYPQIAKVFEDESFASAIEAGSRSLESNQLAIQKLSAFTRNLNRFSLALTVVFALIATLVVVNTMRIAMYAHREEIGIMKLVGATNWFVRGPFLVESVLIGLLAAVLASLILLGGISLLSGWFDALFQGYDVRMASYLTSNFLAIFWGPLFGAVVLSIVSAGIAVGRYLKV
jgi:cell division transport system permease protein